MPVKSPRAEGRVYRQSWLPFRVSKLLSWHLAATLWCLRWDYSFGWLKESKIKTLLGLWCDRGIRTISEHMEIEELYCVWTELFCSRAWVSCSTTCYCKGGVSRYWRMLACIAWPFLALRGGNAWHVWQMLIAQAKMPQRTLVAGRSGPNRGMWHTRALNMGSHRPWSPRVSFTRAPPRRHSF